MLWRNPLSTTQDGFMTEARGTRHVIGVAPVASPVTGTLTPSSGPPSHESNASAESKSKRPLFKLDKFDGSTSLDTFLWKFNQLADYMLWDEKEKFINLCSSLHGPAGQVLRELPTKGTTAQLEELLQTRFGTSKQAASFEAKLLARRRQENETLQGEWHRDISRLVQLAFPNETSSFLPLEGRNAFLNAIEEADLEYEILKLEPKTLSDAVDHAICLECLAESVRARSHAATDKASGRAQRQRNILAVTDDEEPKDKNVELQQRVAQLEQQLKQVTQGGPALLQILLRSLTLGAAEVGVPLVKIATLRLLALINLVRRHTRALSVTNLAICARIALHVKIGQGKKLVSNLS